MMRKKVSLNFLIFCSSFLTDRAYYPLVLLTADIYQYNQIEMIKKAVTLLLLILATQQALEYTLTPSIPPLAFIEQYYTCQLRVPGLTKPTYFYEGLPHFFKGSRSGRIQGYPTEEGNYQVTVTYQEDQLVGRKLIILRVANPNQEGAEVQYVTETVKEQQNTISIPPSLYLQGQNVLIDLRKYIPGNNTWSYEFLPNALEATRQGRIRGVFGNKGIYTFAAVCSDVRGTSTTYIFTINVQPRPAYYYSSNSYQLVSVPTRDTCGCDPIAVLEMQRAAAECLEKAIRKANQAKMIVDNLKAIILKANSDADMAERTLSVTNVLRNKLLKIQSEALKDSIQRKEWEREARNHFDLMVTHYQEHERDVARQLEDVLKAQACFDQSKKLFDEAGEKFKKAQQETEETISLIKKLQLDIVGYRKDVEDLFCVVRDAKKALLQAQKALSGQNIDIDKLYNDRDIANMQNDLAVSYFNLKTDILNKATGELKKANDNVNEIRIMRESAEYEVGKAKFNLQQAMNKLLVAQAAKQASDKAMAIASAQLSQGQFEGSSTYIFGGCDQAGYPSYSGSSRVGKIENGKALLDNGHYLLFGGCTEKGQFKQGDLINFEGYYKNGCIHGVRLTS